MPHIVLLGTLDTKLPEFLYLRSRLLDLYSNGGSPLDVTLIDCGRQSSSHSAIDISHDELVSKYGTGDAAASLLALPRGEVIEFMTGCATRCVQALMSDEHRPVHGMLSAGGSGGTSLVAAVMREVAPIGMPKLIVSTVAAGDTGPLVGETDIALMYSVVDIAGTNALLRQVLSNAAGAMLGMVASYEAFQREQKQQQDRKSGKLRVGVTMFGVTTPCVDAIREQLEQQHDAEVFVFHATGHGGRAMERLVREGGLDAVLDVTTTEICDHIAGGIMSAGPDRLEAALTRGLPTVISSGATDMVNFGPRATVPEKYRDRRLLEHNSTVTLMRTTKEECELVGEFMARKINECAADPGKVAVCFPRGGVSVVATPGQAFADEEADEALVTAFRRELAKEVTVVEDDRAINDPDWAKWVVTHFMELVRKSRTSAA